MGLLVSLVFIRIFALLFQSFVNSNSISIKSLLFILRELSGEEIKGILKKFSPAVSAILHEQSVNVPHELSAYRKEPLSPDSGKNFLELMKQCFSDVNAFAYRHTSGKTLIDHLSADGNTMWYYLRPIVLLSYRSALNNNAKILAGYRMFRGEEISDVVVFGDAAGIKHFLPPHVDVKTFPAVHHNTWTAAGKIIRYIILFKLRFFISIFQISGFLFRKTSHILFDDPKHSQQIIDLKQLKSVAGDGFTGYLKEKAAGKKEFLILSELFIPNLKREALQFRMDYLFARYPKTLNYEFFILFTIINPVTWIKLMRFSSHLRKVYAVLNEQTAQPAEKLLSAIIRDVHRLSLICYLRELSARLFFRIFNPRAIGGDHENELKNKPLLTIARQKGVITFGIQHGIFNEFHYHYTFGEEDKRYNPVPGYMLLWGNRWKNILVNHSIFNGESCKVLGQIRTDCIPLLTGLSKRDILPWFSGKRHLVLYATQHFLAGEEPLQEKITGDFFRLVSRMPDVEFVIKPHPFESDLKIYDSWAKDLGLANFHIVNEDVYKLIAVSDAVLVYSSTVGTETVYFRKPLVVLDYFNNDFMHYADQKVALRASGYDELSETVRGILNGTVKLNTEDQNKFIEENVYRIDGNTSNRYLEFIMGL
ncbi:MAG: hypothetical protein HYY40_00960 [Bacteroidetes bacterium]|nr:hypothetical protein [Bacteroidota bacterium]